MKISVDGLIGLQEESFRDAMALATARVLKQLRMSDADPSIAVTFEGDRVNDARSKPIDHKTTEERESFNYLLRDPASNSERLHLDGKQAQAVQVAISKLKLREKIYRDWGLAKIDPVPRMSLNLVGPPGTGKTLTAHFVAKRLNQKIIEVSYADVVSKYFGQAAKNISKLFDFADRQQAVLFIDEAETLLSRRSTSGADGADHAMNSMRSQLLILLEKTPIITIFASNLVESYDPAFLSRIITIEFGRLDLDARRAVWKSHIPDDLPVNRAISPELLAERFEDLNGRQIAKIVVEAAFKAAADGRERIDIEDFDWAVDLEQSPNGMNRFGIPESTAI